MEKQQTCGEVTYTDDEPILPGTLYAAVVYSKTAVADIVSIDPSEALSIEGVVAFYGAADLPNPAYAWGGFFQDEPLFASKSVVCAGQLIGIVVATDQLLADMASELVKVTYTNKKTPLLSIEDAVAAGSTYTDPNSNFPITVGDVDSAFAKSDFVMKASSVHLCPTCI
jgi:xanthine dehydrogenase/oxidase